MFKKIKELQIKIEKDRKDHLKKFMKECPEGFINYVYGLEIEKEINMFRII